MHSYRIGNKIIALDVANADRNAEVLPIPQLGVGRVPGQVAITTGKFGQ